jgi:dihydroxyacetone kinase-like predicted kinase
MVVQNAMLHTLSKTDVQAVSDRFPELRNRLVDHAEDYQRVQAAAKAAKDIENLSVIKAKKVTSGRAMVITDQDPLAIVKSQLSQQDAKLEQMSGTQLPTLIRIPPNTIAVLLPRAVCHVVGPYKRILWCGLCNHL